MNKNVFLLILFVFVFVLSCAGCSRSSNINSVSSQSTTTNIPTFSDAISKIDEVPTDTLSEVKISQVYIGNLEAGDIISIIEMGGRTTMGEYSENCIKDKKSFDTGEKLYSDGTKLVMGVDEYYSLSKDEQVLLFAGDTSGFLKDFSEPLYDIIGGYDGKLFLQKDGSYAKPKPSDSEKHEFGDGTLKITPDELRKVK